MQTKLIVLVVLFVALVAGVVIATATGGDDEEAPATAEATKPEVEVPQGPPPEELETTDITEGDGAEAQPGDTVTVQYVGVKHSDGEEFDSSWEREPFSFQLGGGEVIPGWDQGVAGMKVGGRRQLVIPPDLAYGREGFPPDIGPNETLVFVVDLVDVEPAAQ